MSESSSVRKGTCYLQVRPRRLHLPRRTGAAEQSIPLAQRGRAGLGSAGMRPPTFALRGRLPGVHHLRRVRGHQFAAVRASARAVPSPCVPHASLPQYGIFPCWHLFRERRWVVFNPCDVPPDLPWGTAQDDPNWCFEIAAQTLIMALFCMPIAGAMCAGEPRCRGNPAYVFGPALVDLFTAPCCALGWGCARLRRGGPLQIDTLEPVRPAVVPKQLSAPPELEMQPPGAATAAV